MEGGGSSTFGCGAAADASCKEEVEVLDDDNSTWCRTTVATATRIDMKITDRSCTTIPALKREEDELPLDGEVSLAAAIADVMCLARGARVRRNEYHYSS